MIALGWVTAAIIASVAIPVMNIPPRNSHGPAPSGVTRWIVHVIAARPRNPHSATRSSSGPFSRIGPRRRAIGRHTIASAAPRRMPLALENVFRYRASTLEMQRPAICQYASGVTSQLSIGPSWYSSAVATEMATAARNTQRAISGRRRRPRRIRPTMISGHTR